MNLGHENSERREVVKTVRLTKSEVAAIERAAVKRVGESGHLISFSDYIRAAIRDALENDSVDGSAGRTH